MWFSKLVNFIFHTNISVLQGSQINSICLFFQGERATGFGVGLLVALFGEHSHSSLLQSSSTYRMVDELQDKNGTKKIRLS